MAILGDKEFYKGIGDITYEGKDSDNPLAFKFYNLEQVVARARGQIKLALDATIKLHY